MGRITRGSRSAPQANTWEMSTQGNVLKSRWALSRARESLPGRLARWSAQLTPSGFWAEVVVASPPSIVAPPCSRAVTDLEHPMSPVYVAQQVPSEKLVARGVFLRDLLDGTLDGLVLELSRDDDHTVEVGKNQLPRPHEHLTT